MQAIFVINLENRTDRRIAMQEQLSRIGWRAEFFSAIRPDSAAGFPSVGARGCFLSHLSVLKIAQKLDIQRVIILEDDVNFVPDFRERWTSSISALEIQEWSIFYPGHVLEGLPEGVSRVPPSTAIRRTHFMVINRKVISTFIGGLEAILSRPGGHQSGGPMHVDGAYSTIRRQNHSLLTYAYSPPMAYQRPSRTDVGNPKWFDRVSFLTPIVNLARKVKVMSRRYDSSLRSSAAHCFETFEQQNTQNGVASSPHYF